MHFDEKNVEKKIVTFVNEKKILCWRAWAVLMANFFGFGCEKYSVVIYQKHS